jgi:hypothetical protein
VQWWVHPDELQVVVPLRRVPRLKAGKYLNHATHRTPVDPRHQAELAKPLQPVSPPTPREGYDAMDVRERQEFVRRLATELGLEEDEVTAAVAGGAAALLPLLLAKESGFVVFPWTTRVRAATASSVGLTIPFADYMFKNRALGWLLSPVGMLVTTALSAGWFAVTT